jgi:hypothetical protein
VISVIIIPPILSNRCTKYKVLLDKIDEYWCLLLIVRSFQQYTSNNYYIFTSIRTRIVSRFGGIWTWSINRLFYSHIMRIWFNGPGRLWIVIDTVFTCRLLMNVLLDKHWYWFGGMQYISVCNPLAQCKMK